MEFFYSAVLIVSAILNLVLVVRSKSYSSKSSRLYTVSAFYSAGVLLMSSSFFIASGGSKSVALSLLVLYIGIRTAQDIHVVSVYEKRKYRTMQ